MTITKKTDDFQKKTLTFDHLPGTRSDDLSFRDRISFGDDLWTSGSKAHGSLLWSLGPPSGPGRFPLSRRIFVGLSTLLGGCFLLLLDEDMGNMDSNIME